MMDKGITDIIYEWFGKKYDMHTCLKLTRKILIHLKSEDWKSKEEVEQITKFFEARCDACENMRRDRMKIAEIKGQIKDMLYNYFYIKEKGSLEYYSQKIINLFEGWKSPEEVEQTIKNPDILLANILRHYDRDMMIRLSKGLGVFLDPSAQPKKVCPDCGGSQQVDICVCCGKQKCDAEGLDEVHYQSSPCKTCTDGFVYGWIPCEYWYGENAGIATTIKTGCISSTRHAFCNNCNDGRIPDTNKLFAG
jgi:hypothetical protein